MPERRIMCRLRTIGLGVVLVASLLAMVAPPFAANLDDPGIRLPSNPLNGRVVFEQKYCIKCHSIAGAGGKVGPDLGESYFSGSFLDLASLLWNHIPDMLVEYRASNLNWPEFSDQEVSDLFSYLYYLRYLGTPGNAARGQRLFQAKGCIACHRVGSNRGGDIGPRLDRLKKYASPIFVVQAIWNHGPRMQERMEQMGLERPEFNGQEINDIGAYIRSESQGAAGGQIYLSPGDPNDGRHVFDAKGCARCHSVHHRGGDIGPALDEVNLNESVTDIAALMWNHGDVMLSMMQEAAVSWPTFKGKEMADLIAYLYFIPFVDPEGDSSRGERLFTDRQCRSCHSVGGEGGHVGPDLVESPSVTSSLSILSALINHGAKMSDTVLRQGKTWPLLSGQDMRDIFAYLRDAKRSAKSE